MLSTAAEPISLWVAKLLGAAVGSSISIAYLLPKSRREAALRLAIGIAVGLTFGGPVGVKMALHLGLRGEVGELEIALMGASAASLCAWWALGALRRLFVDWPDQNKKTVQYQNKGDLPFHSSSSSEKRL
ncbi:MAG: DUF6107 family protein, partial [Pseudomonadota bacterium]